MIKFKKYIYLIYFAIAISFTLNLKAESNEDHCHCVNAQQQTLEYVDDISSNEMSHNNGKILILKEKFSFLKDQKISGILLMKATEFPDPKKKWAKKSRKKI